jgi:hypothetical protein
MLDELRLLRELETARVALVAARDCLGRTPETSPDRDKAVLGYLHATVKHMSIVSVLQARQHELLTAEVADLRKRVEARETLVH